MHLAGSLHECTMNFDALGPSLGGNRLVQSSRMLATVVGTFSKGDIAFWRPSDGSEVCVGRIEGFHLVSDVYIAFVHAFRLDSGCRWLTANAVPMIVSARKLLGTLSLYSDDGNSVYVWFPMAFRLHQ